MRPTANDLTWPALLAHWTGFAQSSLALPRNSDGDRWRSAVPAIINMQAVTFALADLGKLAAPGERALALDKANKSAQTKLALVRELFAVPPSSTAPKPSPTVTQTDTSAPAATMPAGKK